VGKSCGCSLAVVWGKSVAQAPSTLSEFHGMTRLGLRRWESASLGWELVEILLPDGGVREGPACAPKVTKIPHGSAPKYPASGKKVHLKSLCNQRFIKPT
jgi:hypothetical protein